MRVLVYSIDCMKIYNISAKQKGGLPSTPTYGQGVLCPSTCKSGASSADGAKCKATEEKGVSVDGASKACQP